MTSSLALLRAIPIFAGLEPDELRRVDEICQAKHAEPGEYIFREGDPGNRLYIVAAGEVRISREIPGAGEEALAVLAPGALFGEMAVFDRTVRSTDAIATGSTELVTISRADFEMMLDLDRELAYRVLWAVVRLLSGRLRSANDSLRSFLAMSMF